MPELAFDLTANRAAAVLALLQRAKVPPLPVFYGLFFDYVAGARALAGNRLGAILNDGEGRVEQRLYAEFVAPYENNEPLERAIDTMVTRIRVLDGMFARSAEATTAHSRSLQAADQQLSGSIDSELMRELLLRLKVTNERMRRANEELVAGLAIAHDELVRTQADIARSKRTVFRDSLTGIASRAGIDDTISRLLVEDPGMQFSIAVLDVDHFKSLNDTYGHQVGDQVLRVVARALVATVGSRQLVGRMGGDEFAILLPGNSIEAAEEAAETLRLAVTACDLTEAFGGRMLGEVTASLGVAERQPDESIGELFERADRLLYRAKQSGRNRVEALIEG